MGHLWLSPGREESANMKWVKTLKTSTLEFYCSLCSIKAGDALRRNEYVYLHIHRKHLQKKVLLGNYADVSSDSLCLGKAMKSYSVINA